MSTMKVSMRSTVAARPARASTVVVRADSRRAVLGSFAAGVALTAASASMALTPIDIIDDRKVKATGYEIIYEARELDLPQNVRDGNTQARASVEETKKRVLESESRLDSKLQPSIEKAYWTEAREELRRQAGTLRFDLETLASTRTGKDAKKAATALNKAFIAKVEDLDYSLVKKDKAAALTKLEAAKTALDAIVSIF